MYISYRNTTNFIIFFGWPIKKFLNLHNITLKISKLRSLYQVYDLNLTVESLKRIQHL